MPGRRLRSLLPAVNAVLLAAALLAAILLLTGGLASPWMELGALACGAAASGAVIWLWRAAGARGGGN